MTDCAVLPVRFGTVLPDEACVRRFLEHGQSLFIETLNRLAGRVQMEVLVLWDLPIASLKAELAGCSPEEVQAKKVEVGKLVQSLLEQRRTALRQRVLKALAALSPEMIVNDLMDDMMVANVGLLLDEDGRQALDQRLEELDREFASQLTLRCVGPLPPYSFATVEVAIPRPEEVDLARQRLSLGMYATTDDIRRAYRQLAAQSHPDRNHEDADAEARMAELTHAYRLLTSYAVNCGLDGDGPCSFDRETVDNAILIAIKDQKTLAQAEG